MGRVGDPVGGRSGGYRPGGQPALGAFDPVVGLRFPRSGQYTSPEVFPVKVTPEIAGSAPLAR